MTRLISNHHWSSLIITHSSLSISYHVERMANTILSANPISVTVIRTLAGLSQTELARRVGCSQGYISMIEAGDSRQPSPSMLRKIADCLGVPLASLLANPSDEDIHEARRSISRAVPLTSGLRADDPGTDPPDEIAS